jgi:iron complex transport system substrate-binding protein
MNVRFRRQVVLSLLVATLQAATGWCGAPPRTLTDHLGRRVTIAERPLRIVSLAPSLTETVYALGAADRLVGVTDYCDYPPEAQSKSKIGEMLNPNLERITALHPDLVLITKEGNRRDTLTTLERLNIPTFAVETERLEDISRMFRDVGQAVDEAAAGANLAKSLDQRVAAVQRVLKGRAVRRVLMVIWLQPMVSVGKGTFLNDLLERAGARSIAEAEGQPWPKLSVEEIVRSDPEYIVVTRSPGFSPGRDELLKLPGWRELTAVKQDRIVSLPDAAQRPGPRIADMLELLARAIHPEAFTGSGSGSVPGDARGKQ